MFAKIGSGFRQGLDIDLGPVFRGCQLLCPKPTMFERLHKGWLIQINNSAVHETWRLLTDFIYSYLH